ncbi:MAG TPA: DUF3422 domain-containing protein [Gammaproteobacteria bacterium]|nr:DUF3422 domain-containing protein [Gammaproteobacteria bacterium]
MTRSSPIPDNYPQRYQLHNEVHARPFIALRSPERATHLAILLNAEQKAREPQILAALCERYVHLPPSADADHFNADFGTFRLRWERHTEFSTYTFYVRGPFNDPFVKPALESVPADWLKTLPGQVIMAAHAGIQKVERDMPSIDAIAPLFEGSTLVASEVAGGAALACTDFRIHADGFSRFLIYDKGLWSRQAGRLLQRVFEIEVYRMMALRALPVARELMPRLSTGEQKLLDITTAMAEPERNDQELLEELVALAANVEKSVSSTHFRFNAAETYYRLVGWRIDELREKRIEGIQTFREFMERRLEPAMHTCQSVAKRQILLSDRVTHASQLLRTRVEITMEKQNQALLESMDKRARLQLQLQETVEGLSIAAISYYVAGLIGYLAKAGKAAGLPLQPELVVGISIPVVVVLIAFGVRRIRKMVEKK